MANELGTINTRTSVIDSVAGFAKLVAGDDLVVDKASGTGIKVDIATPTFGFEDILGEVLPRSAGIGTPTLATYQGNITQFRFAVNDFISLNYHIPHDYAPGTDIFVHYHWSHIVTTVTGGTITWRVECSYAKGHNQAAFSTPGTIDLSPAPSTTQYQHMLSEVQLSAASPTGGQLTTGDIEPDGVIQALFTLTANAITVSSGGAPDPFLHFVDIHYQSTGIKTKNKSPDFYA